MLSFFTLSNKALHHNNNIQIPTVITDDDDFSFTEGRQYSHSTGEIQKNIFIPFIKVIIQNVDIHFFLSNTRLKFQKFDDCGIVLSS